MYIDPSKKEKKKKNEHQLRATIEKVTRLYPQERRNALNLSSFYSKLGTRIPNVPFMLVFHSKRDGLLAILNKKCAS